jgi:hypothetical protein
MTYGKPSPDDHRDADNRHQDRRKFQKNAHDTASDVVTAPGHPEAARPIWPHRQEAEGGGYRQFNGFEKSLTCYLSNTSARPIGPTRLVKRVPSYPAYV